MNIRKVLLTPALFLLAALTLAACSSDKDSGNTTKPRPTTLVLDYLPNAVHSGIYQAKAADYYKDQGIALKIVEPTSTADTLKLIDSGKADFGIADAIDIAKLIDSGKDVQAILPIVQRPLGGLITLKKTGITRPKDLEGKKVGVTGVPSDDAVLNTIVSSDGGDPSKVKKITTGFNGARNLTNGKIDAFTGYGVADGAQLEHDAGPIKVFALDSFGGPTYPGLVVFTTKKRITEDPKLVEGFVKATSQGYVDVINQATKTVNEKGTTTNSSKPGTDALLKANPSLDKTVTNAQFAQYVAGYFSASAPGAFGMVVGGEVEAMSAFFIKNDLIKKPINSEMFFAQSALKTSK